MGRTRPTSKASSSEKQPAEILKVTDDLLSTRFTFCSQAAVTDDDVEKQGDEPAVMKILTNLQKLLVGEVMDQLAATGAKRTLLQDVEISLKC